MYLIKNVKIIGNEKINSGDILLGGGKFLAVAEDIVAPSIPGVQIFDGDGLTALPGFIDSHVHITGGGGEGGFNSRTPEIQLSDLTTAGVTTVVGCLGTDGVTRSLENLFAKAKSLEIEGINTYIYTGNYRIPVATLTDSVQKDLILIDKVIGIGEVAISDHRSSQPVFAEFVRLVADVRVGAMLAGKKGVVNIHLGDGERMLELIEKVLAETEIPMRHFLPTHLNRNQKLFEKAVEYAKKGGYIDFTTCTTAQFLLEGEVSAAEALVRSLEAGVDISQITFTSDAQGSLPIFDQKGNLCGITVGKPSSLYQAVRDAVKLGIPLATAIRTITANPAAILGLEDLGKIETDCSADIVLVDSENLEIKHVFAKGVPMVENGQAVVKGKFE